MKIQIDPDVLDGFIAEVAGYLPTVRGALGDFGTEADRTAALEEAARMLHCIKGASGMLGLRGLSQIAECLEDLVWDLAGGVTRLAPDGPAAYGRAVAQLEDVAYGLAAGEDGTAEQLDEVRRQIAAVSDRGVVPDEGDLPHDLLDSFDAVPADFDGLPADFGELPPLDGLDFEAETDASAVSIVPPAAVPAVAAGVDDDLREIFRAEAEDIFRAIRTLIPELEANPESGERIQGVRRAVHSLKGAAGAVGLKAISRLAHRMEDMLDRLHAAARAVSPDELRLMIATADALEGMTEGREDGAAVARLFAAYETLLNEPVSEAAPVPAEEPAATTAPAPAVPTAPEKVVAAAATLRVPVERLDEMIRLLVELVTTRATVAQRLADFARFADELRAGADRLRRVAIRFDQHTMRELPTGDKPSPVNRIRGYLEGASYGFDALEFDRYSDAHLLARELTESAVDVQTIAAELGALFGDLDGLQTRQGRVIGEFEDRLFRLRMLPLSSLADRLGRAVRGAAEAVGKQAAFHLTGGETPLDKTILDAMADPLGHLVRNAVAHGIERADARRAAGKPAVGAVTMSAAREGNHVVLRVSDDGAGISPERLRAVAIQRGFLTPDAAAAARIDDLHRLMFLPGFTTAESVDQVAGRGVGLDAVQAQVARLKGSVAVESEPGLGTTFVVRLPLTLAITRALMVESREQPFAIPLDSVLGIHRADASHFAQVGTATVFRVGSTAYPIVRLAEALGLPGDDLASDRMPVVLVRTGSGDVALVVDRLVGGREIVVKGLGAHLRAARGILGATLTGDGKVVLILNPADLSRSERPAARRTAGAPAASVGPTRKRVLIVDDSASVRRVVANVVQKAGWDAVTATDGIDALEVLAEGTRPDVILTDVEMPRMDGYELLAAIRADAATHGLPVVMLTSRAHEKHRRKAMDLGASGYLIKPYEEDVLLSVLSQAADGSLLAEAVS